MVKEYFSKKKELLEDNIRAAKAQLDNFDIQINLLKVRYENDLKVLNDKITRFQEIITDHTLRLKELDKKIAAGYKYIDMITGKAYKTEKGAEQAVKARNAKDKIEEGDKLVILKEAKPKKNGRSKKKEKLQKELEALEKQIDASTKESLDELLNKKGE